MENKGRSETRKYLKSELTENSEIVIPTLIENLFKGIELI